jgi:type II secretory pathway pseudopilin PulG
MQRFGRGDSREGGETLVELLFAMAMLSIAVVTIVGSMATAISFSTRHRQQASAATYLTTAAENVKAADYSPCPSASYSPGFSQSGWTITAPPEDVMAMAADGSVAPCTGADTGLQRVTIRVEAPSGYTISTDIVKRDPS